MINLKKYALTPLNLDSISLSRYMANVDSVQNLNVSIEDVYPPRNKPEIDQNGVGHVWIQDFIGVGLSKFEKMLGNTDAEDLIDEIEGLSSEVDSIVMHINSGGGMAQGNTEASQAIKEIMPTGLYAWNEGLTASAAYNLAVSAGMIGMSESSHIGSIGTIIPFQDSSGFWASLGIEFDNITNVEGDLKGIGMSPSLTPSQRQHLQDMAQESFEMFKQNVLDNRILGPEAMRGQTQMGKKALEMNLVDYIGTYQNFYSQIVNSQKRK